MPTKPGDFLLVNYTLKVKESGQTVDTTYDVVAKESHLHREDSSYGPRFIILGEGWLPKGLEDSLVGVDVGKQTTIELSPEKGYGARDPAKMRLVPLRRFREKQIDPVPGAEVDLDGRPAVVRAVGAGRVQVDYNHPLAGRTLIYDVSIEKVLEDESEKILNVISKRIPEVDKTKFEVNKQGSELTIDVPEEAFYLSGLQVAKKAVTSDLQKYFADIDTISFREVFKRTSPAPEPAETAESKEPTTAQQARPTEEKKTPEVATEPAGQAPRRRRAAGTRRQGTKGSQKRAMMGSESQR
ncbi:MAG TPA: FKBP-type peptidyl-prolyl cis-trans isomerase [Candidatus Dormibacteraeota bacterium]|jgi:peptidylprolyl isomerase|nr:FKBP-type peptidyl-prolyl cis-trans isomerase [Candidatus Dormibacteraeota bacterium]